MAIHYILHKLLIAKHYGGSCDYQFLQFIGIFLRYVSIFSFLKKSNLIGELCYWMDLGKPVYSEETKAVKNHCSKICGQKPIKMYLRGIFTTIGRLYRCSFFIVFDYKRNKLFCWICITCYFSTMNFSNADAFKNISQKIKCCW